MATKVVIVGAGFLGVSVAKTYLEVDPTIHLTILESESTIGGTWSKSRVYPELTAQQPFGVYEFPDKSIPTAGYRKTDFVPAEAIHQHIEEYAKEHGIYDCIRFNATVTKIRRAEDGIRWIVWTDDGKDMLVADKLVIATGSTSKPTIPEISTEKFEKEVFHTKDLGKKHEYLLSDAVKTVTVYGGGKSAMDTVHLCTKAGKHVHWVVRTSHNGVPAFFPDTFLGMSSNDIITTRLGKMQHPSPLDTSSWCYRFFHSGHNPVGYHLHWMCWNIISKMMLKQTGYFKSDNMGKLRPELEDHHAWWANTPPGIITHPEVIDRIHEGKNVTIHRQSITSLSGDRVILDAGELQTDVLIWATGYDSRIDPFSIEDSITLGIPTPVSQVPTSVKKHWDDLESAAEAEVLRLFPRLANPPKVTNCEPKYTPFRLYRTLVPLACIQKDVPDRSLVFAGTFSVGSSAMMSVAVSLWAVAWMTGNVDVTLSSEELDKQLAMAIVFSKRRYLSIGTQGPVALYDYMTDIDSMLNELGVNPKRKKGTLKDFFEPYAPRDYKDIVPEWKKAHGLDKASQ
ncbi:FAD/NAD(P)-binding domain-containing protein [Choiromyces venosus 120613-1]|uniref:FAD/NAD(P)-binding domain-containing protein n=1 Tax=Choiromyces venosus 120613-1 TaxID=1336337 RepID=A0A3N4K5T0_9PEZI|nr:FAD/NAD(P)-binding domain-containing protein [Choiromyces venosus 120613-1]